MANKFASKMPTPRSAAQDPFEAWKARLLRIERQIIINATVTVFGFVCVTILLFRSSARLTTHATKMEHDMVQLFKNDSLLTERYEEQAR
jgi:hypothetical protein